MSLVFLLLGMLAFFLVIGIPIGIAIGLSGLIIAYFSGIDIIMLAQKFLGSGDSFSLLAIPFFMLAGSIMSTGGVSRRIVAFAYSIVSSMTGGLAQVTLVGSLFFSALSGSSSATTAAVGGIMIPNMKQKKYPEKFSASVAAAGGALGPIIPPSILLIIYGVSTQQSIGKLFLAGIGPGILMTVSLGIVIYIQSKRYGLKSDDKFSFSEVLRTFKEGFWGLLMPVIILGGIYGGIFTPTESAAIGAFYGFIVSVFIYRELKIKDLGRVLLEAAKNTAMVMFILFAAGFFGWILVYHNIPQMVASSLMELSQNPTIILILITILLVIIGTFMNAQPALLIIAPILYPTSVTLGIDPIFFGMVLVMALVIGVITPPVGVDLFVASAISKVPVESVARATFPFVLVLVLDTILLIIFPQIAMFLPDMFG